MCTKIRVTLDAAHEVAKEWDCEPRVVARVMLHNIGITCIAAADELINRHMHETYAAACVARCTRD